MINQAVNIASIPLDQLQNNVSDLQNQSSELTTLQTRFYRGSYSLFKAWIPLPAAALSSPRLPINTVASATREFARSRWPAARIP